MDDPSCPQCHPDIESASHMLRDCLLITALWCRIFTQSLQDGAFGASVGKSAGGGTLRDSHGMWNGGFSLKVGKCTAYREELWGVYEGLLLAWDLGYRKIDL
ncbi:Ribonuclease H protein, putative [Theobroma cacao]|uniref:Ribonuclease H protein, putative n=1 Tax=Theobroma cacao TaxID=3641 RepID=A0A061E605_THECC|nr:Ribonuclease H protein, putative [Theobroma cacao]